MIVNKYLDGIMISSILSIKINHIKSYTKWDIRGVTFVILTSKEASFINTVAEYSVPTRSYTRFSQKVLVTLICIIILMCRSMAKRGILTDTSVVTVVAHGGPIQKSDIYMAILLAHIDIPGKCMLYH